eukprot:260503_1
MNNEQLISKLESSILWTNLKSKDDPDLQIQTASQFRDILLSGCTTVSEYNYVLSSILDEKIKTCVFSTLPHEIIGGILLISELILYIICKFEELLEFFSRYGTYLTEILLKCNSHGSISVVALCCTTLGQYSRHIVESHVSQCIKWISLSYNKQTCCEQHESFILAKNRKKENKPYEKYIKYPLKCLLMLSNALNNEISLFFNNEKNIIQNIFDLGLSKSILKCIQNIYQNVYSYQPLIQDKLSRMVWMLLLYNINPPKHQQNNGINHSDEESKHQQNNDHHHNIHDHSDGNEDNIHDIHTNDIMDINMNINHNMHMHMNINHNIDDDDEYNKNIMYYHYKYNTTTFNIQRQQCITNNQYINKYNTNEEIPPFVSPPIINIKTQIKSHGGPSINPVLGPRKPSDYTDYNNEYSHGSLNNLHSPHNVVYNMSEQQRRRNSSVHHNDNNHQNQDINLNITEFQDKELRNPKLIQLALETMSKFNLHDVNINLLHFVRETVLFYCNHTNINIRKQAGITCCILLSRIIQQMEKEKDHLKLHWIEMNNTHSIKPQIIEQNNSIPTPSNINNIYGDKSVTTTPQNQPFYTSPLWAMSYPSLPFVDPPNTTNTNTNNDNMNMNNNMSLHIPTNMYINDNILSEIKDDDEIIITSSHNNNNNEHDNNKCDGLHMQLSGQHKHESSINMHILAILLSLTIADVEIEVREQLLLSLLENKLFYTYLSQQQLLPSLFIALNDEYFGVREIALKLLGILATYNPAHIMPFIRKNLLELLTYLDNRTLLSIEQQKEDINHRQQ